MLANPYSIFLHFKVEEKVDCTEKSSKINLFTHQGQKDLNPRHSVLETDALPLNYTPSRFVAHYNDRVVLCQICYNPFNKT